MYSTQGPGPVGNSILSSQIQAGGQGGTIDRTEGRRGLGWREALSSAHTHATVLIHLGHTHSISPEEQEGLRLELLWGGGGMVVCTALHPPVPVPFSCRTAQLLSPSSCQGCNKGHHVLQPSRAEEGEETVLLWAPRPRLADSESRGHWNKGVVLQEPLRGVFCLLSKGK